jgi:phage N-6-adenine-methyltransferase
MEQLTKVEKSILQECEEVIDKGMKSFIEVGNALLKIRDGKLYKTNFSTFEDYCRERWGMERRQAYRLMDAADVVENVSRGTQILPTSERQARPLSLLSPKEQADIWEEVVETAPGGKITASFVQEVINKKAHVSNNSGENEWYTPSEFVESARKTIGSIDTDPASSDIANKTVRAKTYYTKQENGLEQKWTGNVWMNPPYAQPLISQFVDTFISKFSRFEFEQGIVLVNNATETAWFQRLLECAGAVCFVKTRIRFLDPDGNLGAPLQGQAILYFGENVAKFSENFEQFGRVLYA